ncbi:MAG: sigma-54-dependent Fis family transcriptional regulator, partial [Planctomycetes bacterium]|nr:sigma-54-dependent Fis family transcriptional regulator [Planctomycetota bacterium]
MTEEPGTIDVLIADDEESMREFLDIVLSNEGLAVQVASSGDAAIEMIADRPPRVFVQDLRMGGLDGMDLLRRVKELAPAMPVVVMTAYSTWETAVDAMRLGAFDYLKKPFDTDHIRSIVHRAMQVETSSGSPSVARAIVGSTPVMQRVYDLIEKVAPTDSTVLIRGESGSGKELIARSIHGSSHRRDHAFVPVNCSAFTENLLESELFGHVRGSFTGAVEDRKGLFQAADGGTLFLDEVADMSSSTQVKILRVLEERRVTPVGGHGEIPTDVRIIAATNRDLEDDVREGRFREDLFYRLNVIPLNLPPLRERKEDIPLLAGHFLARYARSMGRPVRGLAESAKIALLGYDWPGNVRELDNVIQRHVALCEGEIIDRIDLSSKPGRHGSSGTPDASDFTVPDGGIVLDEVLEDIERRYLLSALEKTEGNLTKAAQILGMSYRSI